MAALTTDRRSIREKAMKALGLYQSLVCSAPSASTTIAVVGLKNVAVDDERFQYANLYSRNQDEWVLITDTDVSAGTLTVSIAFSADANANLLELLLVLNFDEINDAINDALEDKFYETRDVVTLVSGQTEYTLSNWIKNIGQIKSVRIRDVGAGSTKPIEIPLAALHPYEVAGVVKIMVPGVENAANITYEVVARRYQVPLTSDTSQTTTIPERLCVAAAKYEILKKIFIKMGPAAKRHFGMAMKLAEDDLAAMELRHMDAGAKRDYTASEVSVVGGNPEANVSWGW